MAAVDMKNTDYYKSGKMKENGLAGSMIAKEVNIEILKDRISAYDKNPKQCGWCGLAISYAKRHNMYCTKSCSAKASNAPRKKNPEPKYLIPKKFEDVSFDTKRKMIIDEQQGKCNRCGISTWLGKPILIQIDHIDGDNRNDSRSNLEGLCPNCHSQTDTFCGKNKNNLKDRNRVSDEFLFHCLKESESIRQGLLMAGLAAKGRNYIRAKKLLGS